MLHSVDFFFFKRQLTKKKKKETDAIGVNTEKDGKHAEDITLKLIQFRFNLI